jgi:hypothetical protein
MPCMREHFFKKHLVSINQLQQSLNRACADLFCLVSGFFLFKEPTMFLRSMFSPERLLQVHNILPQPLEEVSSGHLLAYWYCDFSQYIVLIPGYLSILSQWILVSEQEHASECFCLPVKTRNL